MTKRTALPAILLAAAVATPMAAALADNFPQATIMIVDYNKIQAQSRASQDVRRQVEALQRSYQAQTDRDMASLNSEEQRLRTDAPKLSDAQRVQRQKAFEDKVAAAQKSAQARNKALSDMVDGAGQKVSQALVPIFSQIMGQAGGNVLLGTNEVLYYDPSYEITDQVLQQLNASLSSVKVTVPPTSE